MGSFYTLAGAVERLESISESAQDAMHSVILETMYRKKPTACFCDREQDLADLEAAGLVVRVDDPEGAMRFLGRNELVRRLSAAGVEGFKKGGSLDALVGWCMETPDGRILDAVADVSAVVPAAELERVRKKVYIYLSRKYESESCFDPDLEEMIDVPKGAQFVTELRLDGGGGLRCEFPDDEITALLDKYGCNRCRTWRKPE